MMGRFLVIVCTLLPHGPNTIVKYVNHYHPSLKNLIVYYQWCYAKAKKNDAVSAGHYVWTIHS